MFGSDTSGTERRRSSGDRNTVLSRPGVSSTGAFVSGPLVPIEIIGKSSRSSGDKSIILSRPGVSSTGVFILGTLVPVEIMGKSSRSLPAVLILAFSSMFSCKNEKGRSELRYGKGKRSRSHQLTFTRWWSISAFSRHSAACGGDDLNKRRSAQLFDRGDFAVSLTSFLRL